MKTKIILSSLSMMLVAFLISAFAAGESNIQKTTVEGAKTSKINRKSNLSNLLTILNQALIQIQKSIRAPSTLQLNQ